MFEGRKAVVAAALETLFAAGSAVAGIAIIKPYAVGVDGDYYTNGSSRWATPSPRRAIRPSSSR